MLCQLSLFMYVVSSRPVSPIQLDSAWVPGLKRFPAMGQTCHDGDACTYNDIKSVQKYGAKRPAVGTRYNTVWYHTIHPSRSCVIIFFMGQGRFYGVADRRVFLFCQPNFGRNYYPQRYLSSSTLTYLRSKTHDVLKKSMQRYITNQYLEIKILPWQYFENNMIISDLGTTLNTTMIYLLHVKFV